MLFSKVVALDWFSISFPSLIVPFLRSCAHYCRVNSGVSISDLTVREAVEYLSHPEENFQQCGATFIQHITFKEERTKEEV